MIPNTVHFIWMTKDTARAEDPLPNEVRDQIFAWHQHASHCAIHCWSWGDFIDAMTSEQEQECVDLIKTCRFTAMRADVMRLAIIKKYGGIWSDIKNLPTQSLLKKLPLDKEIFIAEHWPIPQKSDTTGFFSNSLFGAKANHPFICDSLSFALEKIKSKSSDDSIPWLTGGGVFTRLSKRGDYASPHAIKASDCWNNWLKRKSMEYNDGGKHWSERQKNEPLYY